jgi:hypothetical protein
MDVFFCTEEAHTVVLAKGSPCGIPRRGFRLTAEIPQGKDGVPHDIAVKEADPLTMDDSPEACGGTGSSGKSRRNAPAQFGVKKDIPIPPYATE